MENVMRWGSMFVRFRRIRCVIFWTRLRFFFSGRVFFCPPLRGGVRRLGVIERNHLGWVFEGRNRYIWEIGVEVGWKWWVGWKETSQAIVRDQWRYFQPLFKGVKSEQVHIYIYIHYIYYILYYIWYLIDLSMHLSLLSLLYNDWFHDMMPKGFFILDVSDRNMLESYPEGLVACATRFMFRNYGEWRWLLAATRGDVGIF